MQVRSPGAHVANRRASDLCPTLARCRRCRTRHPRRHTSSQRRRRPCFRVHDNFLRSLDHLVLSELFAGFLDAQSSTTWVRPVVCQMIFSRKSLFVDLNHVFDRMLRYALLNTRVHLSRHSPAVKLVKNHAFVGRRSLSTSTPLASPRPSKLRKWARRVLLTSSFIGVGWVVDEELNAAAIGRNFRTFWTVRAHLTPSSKHNLHLSMKCALIALDYKINFTPEKTEEIPELHQRVADRVYNLLTSNGGLYIKIGTRPSLFRGIIVSEPYLPQVKPLETMLLYCRGLCRRSLQSCSMTRRRFHTQLS